MSTTIEEKVVEMRFDNRQFEQNVQTSISTVEKLKQSLNLTGAAKGLDSVNNAAKNVDMSGLGSAVETVRAKFSALDVIGVTALSNITNSAVNAGKRLISSLVNPVKELTIGSVKTGFSEYETKINSIQTIMSNTASKGTTMEDVTRVIDELNTYADKTIYNFAEMTKNIGTFTAAGVGLEESATAIQGIANLAASSGSTSQQASTAMYQLSQALSTGVVKLMDWNSVVNAGMGGEKFQEALKATAREYGVGVDEIIEKNGSFRDSLSEGWLTADILNTTLQKFTTGGADEYAKKMVESGEWTQKEADALKAMAQEMEDAATKVKTFTQLWDTLKEAAQSGWSQSWEIIVGNFEEAKELFTQVSDVIGGMIGKSAEARNKVLQGWKDLGGRQAIVDGLKHAFEGVMNIVKPISEAFREIFPPVTSEQLLKFSEGFRNLMESFKNATADGTNLKKTFKGIFAIVKIGVQLVSALFNGVKTLLGGFSGLGGGILNVTGGLGDWLVKLSEVIQKSDIFNKAIQKVVGFVVEVIDAIKSFAKSLGFKFEIPAVDAVIDKFKSFGNTIKSIFNGIKEKFKFPAFDLLKRALETIRERMSNISDAAGAMREGVGSAFEAMGAIIEGSIIFKILKSLWTLIKAIGTLVKGVFKKLADRLSMVFDGAGSSDILDIINSISITAIVAFVAKIVKKIKELGDSAGDLKDSIIEILDGVRGCFEAFQTKLKAEALMEIAKAIAVLVAALVVLAFVDNDKLLSGVAVITALFTDLMAAMAVFSKIGGTAVSLGKATGVMIGLATAVVIMSSALAIIGGLSGKEMVTGALGIAAMIGMLIVAVKLLGGKDADVIKGASKLVILAVAVKIMASALADLAAFDSGALGGAVFGLAGVVAAIVVMAKTLSKSSLSASSAASIILIGIALKILISSIEDLGSMDTKTAWSGIAAMTAILLALSGCMILIGKFGGDVTKNAGTILALSVGVLILSSAITKLGKMNLTQALTGVGSLVVVLGALAGALTIMGKFGGDTSTNTKTILAISAGVLILSIAISNLGKMSLGQAATGVGTLVVVLAALSGALVLIGKFGGDTSKTTGTILAISVALLVLSSAISSLGKLGLAGAAVGVGAIVVVLAALAGSMVRIGQLAGNAVKSAAAILIMAAALSVLTPAIMLLGTMNLTSIGVALLAIAGTFVILGVAGLVLQPLAPIIMTLAGAVALLGLGGLALGVAMVAMGAGLALAGTGLTAFAAGFVAFAAAFLAGSGSFTQALTVILTGLIGLIPALLVAIGEGLIAVCQVIITGAPVIAEAIATVIVSTISALLVSLQNTVPLLFETLGVILDSLLNFLLEFVPKIVNVGLQLLLGLLEGIASNIQDITATALLIIEEFLRGIAEGLPGVIDAAMELAISFINGLADGIRNNTDAMIAAVDNLMDAFFEAVVKWFTHVFEKGAEIRGKLIEGIKSKISELLSAGGELIDNLISGITDGISGMWSAGVDAVQGFIDGIESMVSDAWSAAKNVGESALNGIKKFLGINSPSREFAEVGMGVDEGLVKGMKDYSGMVVKASRGVGETALDTMKSTMNRISDVINSDIDSQPTIRPVLDLDGVRSGANKLNSMLALGSTIGMSANVGAVSAMMNNRSQNGANGDIVSELKKLRSDFNNMDRSSYNINGVTYDDGSNIANAVKTITRAAKVARRV